MTRKWVLDSSPIIALAKISYVDLFEKLSPELVVPDGVAKEVTEGPSDDPGRAWIEGPGSRFICPKAEISTVVQAWDLGIGESEALSWAYFNPTYEAILDDRGARNCASALGILLRGTVGVVLLAKKEGLVPEIEPLLKELTVSGLRISRGLSEKELRLAGEA